MKDIQNLPDYRKINIQKVGVKNISYPITVLDKKNKTQKTVATVNMYVNLPHQFKGTHMSRFVEILNHYHGEINLRNFHLILTEMKSKLQAEAAHMEIEFPYFLKKPNSSSSTTVEYHCKLHGSFQDTDDLELGIEVPIFPPLPQQQHDGLPKSLGHWGVAIINVRFQHFLWIEDLIRMIETVTTHDLSWPTTAADFQTDSSLEVEHLTEDLGQMLKDCEDIKWFLVTVKNFSQGCNTFASIEWPPTHNIL